MPAGNDSNPNEEQKRTIQSLDDEVEKHQNSLEQPSEEPNEDRRSMAWTRLSASTRLLGSSLKSMTKSVDESLQISKTVKNIDEKTQISSNTKQTTESIQNWYTRSGDF